MSPKEYLMSIDVSSAIAALTEHKTRLELAIQALESLGSSSIAPKKRGHPKGSTNSTSTSTSTSNSNSSANVLPMKKTVGRPKAVPQVRKARTFTAAQRKQQAARMKAYWAAKRKAS
jgi:hypothetical protein